MNDRALTAVLALASGLVLIVSMHFALPDAASDILLDKFGATYPASIQNLMWLTFALGIGEVIVRARAARLEHRQLAQAYLPEDSSTVLEYGDLGRIYQRAKNGADSDTCFLPRLILRSVLQFQASRSTEQASTLLNSSLELFQHEIDLRYNMLRYLMWLIPSLGFIGTVVGIGLALSYAGDPANAGDTLLFEVTRRLAVAFNTTLVGLVMASALVFAANVVQASEERSLNLAGQYCLDNLINRLYSE